MQVYFAQMLKLIVVAFHLTTHRHHAELFPLQLLPQKYSLDVGQLTMTVNIQ